MNDSLSSITTRDTQALDIIRSETALSRYPIHRVANKGTVNIEIKRKDEKGTTTFLWEVSHNSRYGQPGPLAYRLDTLIINRKIDEAGKPAPKILRLGSLFEIAQELNLGGDTNLIKKALRQNASAFITAKTTYKGTDGIGHSFEFSDTRYGVIFTGEKMPDGRKADAVYLVFHDLYLVVLNTATRRPLDYDYLRSLAPGPQRFYEIVSYEMLPAIKYNQRAKLPYSEFCMYSTMTRYEDFDHVKKQMYKIHQPHIKAGYIAKVEFEATTDEEGRPDWNMFYVPGERAKFQQLVFSFEIPYIKREREKKSAKTLPVPTTPTPAQEALPLAVTEAGENKDAQELVREFYRVRYGQVQEPTAREITEATGYLSEGEAWAKHLTVFAARHGKDGNGFPNDFGGVKKLASQARGEFETKYKAEGETRLKKARQSHEKAHKSAYQAFLGHLLRGSLETTLPGAFTAFREAEEKERLLHKRRISTSEMSAKYYREFDEEEKRIGRLLNFMEKNPKTGIPTFWQWDERLNPVPFDASKV